MSLSSARCVCYMLPQAARIAPIRGRREKTAMWTRIAARMHILTPTGTVTQSAIHLLTVILLTRSDHQSPHLHIGAGPRFREPRRHDGRGLRFDRFKPGYRCRHSHPGQRPRLPESHRSRPEQSDRHRSVRVRFDPRSLLAKISSLLRFLCSVPHSG
jgi:hypothetical protein